MNPQNSTQHSPPASETARALPHPETGLDQRSPLDLSFKPEHTTARAPERDQRAGHAPAQNTASTNNSIGERIQTWWMNLHPVDKIGGCLFTGLGLMEATLFLMNPTGTTAIAHLCLVAVDAALAFRRFKGTLKAD